MSSCCRIERLEAVAGPARPYLAIGLSALVAGLAAGLWAPGAAAAPDACMRTQTGTGADAVLVVTCRGDQSDGIDGDDLVNSTPGMGVPATFPGRGSPATPAAETITVRVRELGTNDIAPTSGRAIDIRLAPPTDPPSAPLLVPPPRAFVLDVDLGTARSLAAAAGGVALDATDAAAAQRATSLDITLNGRVSTTAANAHGVEASTSTGSATVLFGVTRGADGALTPATGTCAPTVTGNCIQTTGERADGIRLSTEGLATGATGTPPVLRATVGGTIRTTGGPDMIPPRDGPRAAALRATVADGDGNTHTARGDIELTLLAGSRLETPGLQARGIDARTEAGDITITSAGTIATARNPSVFTSAMDSGIFAEASGRGDVSVTLETGGQIEVGNFPESALRFGGPGIEASTNQGHVAVTVNGAVRTSGFRSHGVYASTNTGSATVLFGVTPGEDDALTAVPGICDAKNPRNSSNCIQIATGDAVGILLRSTGLPAGAMRMETPPLLRATVGGTIETTGANAPALRAQVSDADPAASRGNVELSVLSGAVLQTRGSRAIDASTERGEITVTSAGTLTTAGIGADGILAFLRDGEIAIDVRENGQLDGDRDVDEITTTGPGARGIFARILGDGDVGVTLGAGSSIRSLGGGSGIEATVRGAGDAAVTLEAGSAIEAGSMDPPGATMPTCPPLVTSNTPVGISVCAANGNATVIAEGTVAVRGPASTQGIVASAGGAGAARVTLGAGGEISTAGTGSANSAAGIEASATQGDVAVTVNGAVSTAGNGAQGVFLRSAGLAANAMGTPPVLRATVGGTILTTGGRDPTTGQPTSGQGAAALRALVADGDGNTRTARGDIELTLAAGGRLETRGERAHGIAARTGAGDITVTSAGTIATAGDRAYGIAASLLGDGNVEIDVQDNGLRDSRGTDVADITTRGPFAVGILGLVAGDGDVGVTLGAGSRINTEGGDIGIEATVRGAGDATVTLEAGSRIDAGFVGIDVGVADGDATVEMAGTVAMRGANSRSGVFARAGRAGATRVTLAAGGVIHTTGDSGAPGINATSVNGTTTVVVGGNIGTQGQQSRGVSARARTSGAVTVDVMAGGGIRTAGAASHGVDASTARGNIDLSVGGAVMTSGAGAAGLRASIDDRDPDTAVTGRSEVTVAAGGAVVTTGGEAPGIEIFSATSGDIADAMVTVDGTVRTSGAGSAALRVRVDDGNDATAAVGNIDLTVAGRGELRAEGADAAGVYASTERGNIDLTVGGAVRSTGTGPAVREEVPLGAGRLALTVGAGGVVTGATAVALRGGSSDVADPNRIDVLAGGRVAGALALGAGVERVDNRGVLSLLGDSQFGAGADRLENRGVLNLLGSAQFGPGTDHFEQAGRLEPGGSGRIGSVSVRGAETVNFAASGVLAVEVDGMAGRADRVSFGAEAAGAPGAAVTLGGVVEVRELPGRSNFRRGERRHVVLTADRDFAGGALGLRAPEFALDQVIQRRYALERDDREVRLVERTVGSFLVADAGPNVRAVGEELDRLATGVSPVDLPAPFTMLLSGLGDLRLAAYARAVNDLHAEPYDALLQGDWQAERSLVEGLWAGCRPGRESGICVFGGLFGRTLDRVRGRESSGFEEVAVGPRGGLVRELGEYAGRSWELRLGASYEALDLAWRRGGGGRGDRLLGGLVLHSRSGAGGAGGSDGGAGLGLVGLDVGLALAGGGAWFETERRVNRLGIAEAEAEPETAFLGGHGRLVYRVGGDRREPGWYGELGLEGSAVAVWLDAFAEDEATGGALRLRVSEAEELYTSLRPQLSLGGSWTWGEVRWAPHARLGVNYAVGSIDTPFRARWPAAPAAPAGPSGASGVGFTTRGDSESVLIEAGGGLQLTWSERLSVEVGYAGRVSPDGTARFHQGQLRAELRF